VNEKCDCYATWTGADCSLRSCKFGRAWAADDNDPHAYLECSGQGACNRCVQPLLRVACRPRVTIPHPPPMQGYRRVRVLPGLQWIRVQPA